MNTAPPPFSFFPSLFLGIEKVQCFCFLKRVTQRCKSHFPAEVCSQNKSELFKKRKCDKRTILASKYSYYYYCDYYEHLPDDRRAINPQTLKIFDIIITATYYKLDEYVILFMSTAITRI